MLSNQFHLCIGSNCGVSAHCAQKDPKNSTVFCVMQLHKEQCGILFLLDSEVIKKNNNFQEWSGKISSKA
jgi:hypothetical protein